MTLQNREAIDEFNYRYVDGPHVSGTMDVGLIGLFKPKPAKDYTNEEKVQYMSMIHLVDYLQTKRRELSSDDEWFYLLDCYVADGQIPGALAKTLKQSSRDRLTKAQWDELHPWIDLSHL